MKSKFKLFALSLLTLFVLSSVTESDAQTRKVKSSKKVAVAKANKRVSRTNVVYRTPKKKVVSVRNLPRKTQVVRHNGLKYHYDNNRFYRYYGGRYVVVVPRVGLRINTLPVGHVRVAFGNRHYFWFDGIFYINVGNEYEIVQPEIATIIYELPSSYERVKIDGYTYYEYNDVLYEKVQVDGIRAYEVVGFIE